MVNSYLDGFSATNITRTVTFRPIFYDLNKCSSTVTSLAHSVGDMLADHYQNICVFLNIGHKFCALAGCGNGHTKGISISMLFDEAKSHWNRGIR